MELTITKILTCILIPPVSLIITAILGLCLSLFRRKLGLWLTMVSLIVLLLCSLPVVSANLVNTLQGDAPILPDELKQTVADAEAVVLLAGGRQKLAEEYGDDTVNSFSLVRARYAAWIVKQTHLPLIISGGRVLDEAKSESELIHDLLQNEFNLSEECCIEEQSRTTYENALYTAKLLEQKSIQSVVLVTHAWHMPRARAAFEHFDVRIIPAPTAFYGRDSTNRINYFLPSTNALMFSGMAFHEMFGNWWYKMRYY